MSRFGRFSRQCFIMERACPFRVEGEVELIFPAKFKAGFGQGIVPHLGPGVTFGQVGGVSRDLVGDHPFFYILFVWKTQMLSPLQWRK